MDAPTATTIRLWMPASVDFGALGYDDDEQLQQRIDEVIAQLRRFTCRSLPDIVVEDEPLYRRALWMLTYLSMIEMSEDRLDTLADFDLIKSFGAGNYNEVRRDFAEMFKARMLVPWGALNTLLWDLMTDECRERWEEHFDAANAPWFEIHNESHLMTGEHDYDPESPWV